MVPNLGKEEPPAARRGTRRRPGRESALVWWALFAAVAGAAWWLQSWRVALLGLLGWCLYQFMLVPTMCRVLSPQGAACTERTRGRLFACGRPDHQRLRNDALWRLAGLRNPFQREAAREETESGVVVVSRDVRGRLVPQDRSLILLAAVGTIAALVGMIYGFR
jgi:ferric-dicitrate binding protein FerR (iron transport regulator)